jgi:hypothetical protein
VTNRVSKESIIKVLDTTSYVFFVCFIGLLPLLGSVSFLKLYFLPNIALIALSANTVALFILKKQYAFFVNGYFWPFLVFVACIITSSIVNGLFFGFASNLLYVFISIIIAFFVINN